MCANGTTVGRAGNYTVQYADGSRAVLPVRLTGNVKRFDTTAPATRAALETRLYVDAQRHCRIALSTLFQWEWINPHPEREIVGVVAEHDNLLDVSLVVLAISGRESFPLGPWAW